MAKPPTQTLDLYSQLPQASLQQLQGRPVGGLWRQRNNLIELQRFGGSWTPARQPLAGPKLTLLDDGVVFAPARP